MGVTRHRSVIDTARCNASGLLTSGSTLFTPGLMQQTGSTQTFWQTDALGSVRGTSNNAQSPTGEVYYDAFGNPSLRQGQMPGPQLRMEH